MVSVYVTIRGAVRLDRPDADEYAEGNVTVDTVYSPSTTTSIGAQKQKKENKERDDGQTFFNVYLNNLLVRIAEASANPKMEWSVNTAFNPIAGASAMASLPSVENAACACTISICSLRKTCLSRDLQRICGGKSGVIRRERTVHCEMRGCNVDSPVKAPTMWRHAQFNSCSMFASIFTRKGMKREEKKREKPTSFRTRMGSILDCT
jgi:hypothetical protein